jgi:hypothetical protein
MIRISNIIFKSQVLRTDAIAVKAVKRKNIASNFTSKRTSNADNTDTYLNC